MRDQKLPNEGYIKQKECFITLPQDLNLHKTQTIWLDKSYKMKPDSRINGEVTEIKDKGHKTHNQHETKRRKKAR